MLRIRSLPRRLIPWRIWSRLFAMNSMSRPTAGKKPLLLEPTRPDCHEMSPRMSEGPDHKAEGKAPLALQAAMWRASIRDRRLYRQHFIWKLHGKVDPQLMRQAWEATLRRHEIFSLAMSRDDGNDLFFTKCEGPCLVWIEREVDGAGGPW